LGEVNIREKFRARLLSGLFSRQIVEVFSPMVKCCYNMMLQAGRLGVMPKSRQHFEQVLQGKKVKIIPNDIAAAMLRGEHVYEIKFLTPAMRMVQAELMGGILNTWKFMNDVAQAAPEVYDNINQDMSVQLIAEYAGAPLEIIRSNQFMVQIRDARQKQQEQQQKFQQQLEMAKVAVHAKPAQQQPPGVQATPEMAEPLKL
jgi:hypothetical protein